MRKKINRFFDIIDDPIDIILIPIYTILGKIYLRIRYPSKEKRDEVFQNDFDSRYELVVKLKIIQLVAFIFALIVLGGLIFFTVKIIRGEM